MNKFNFALAQTIDFADTDAAPSTTDVRDDVRSLEESELVYVGGGDSIPNW